MRRSYDEKRTSRLELLGQLGHSLEQVRHQCVVGDLDNGGFWVLVDGDDTVAKG